MYLFFSVKRRGGSTSRDLHPAPQRVVYGGTFLWGQSGCWPAVGPCVVVVGIDGGGRYYVQCIAPQLLATFPYSELPD